MIERIPYLLAASAVTAALHILASVPWGWAAFAAFVGWPVIGTIITIDDDLPGGFSNPNGVTRPEWLGARFWGQVLLGLGIAATVATIDTGLSASTARFLVPVALAAFALSVVLFRRTPKEGRQP